MPCTIRILPVPRTSARFHDFAEFERLVEAARKLGWCSELIALLGGDSGLRRGLCREVGSSLTPKMVGDHVRRAARKAQLKAEGVHVLRHTFCSHLAMRGAPARAIHEMAGHQEFATTRYMHLSLAALEGAIRLLDSRPTGTLDGDILETASAGD